MAAVGLSLALGGATHAQMLPAKTFSSGGGKSTGGGYQHMGNTGLGVAVGATSGNNRVVRHGFLVGAARVRDETPPTFNPVPGDLVVPTAADRCEATVALPAVNVVDNRDPNPTVTVTLQTNPPQDIDVGGEQVDLPLGTYDVLVVATDRYGNEARTSYRLDVVDRTAPTFVPVPDPTPVGQAAEAAAPTGTVVQGLTWDCADACDANPVASRAPAIVRYPIGDTAVDIRCRDAAGNEASETVTVRVRDTQPPGVSGQMPRGIETECESPQGADIEVPVISWQDAGYAAADIDVQFVLNPDGENRAFDAVPDTLLLPRGDHVFRYRATDGSGNSSSVDLQVSVIDNGVPEITVVNAPDNGWHGGNDPLSVTLDVTDGCSAGLLDVQVMPPPTDIQRDGNRITLQYQAEGVYQLRIAIEDADGNETIDQSIAFGIDRNPPEPVLLVPSQQGVAPADAESYPIFPRAEMVALSAGGEEAADGVASGIANVTVVLDPDGEARVLADHDFDGNGNPARGDRVVANVACELRRGGALNQVDGVCDPDAELALREVPVGVHELEIIVTDFAGNSGTASGWLINADLHAGAAIVRGRLQAILDANPGLAPGAAQRLQQSVAVLTQVGLITDERVAGTAYETPRFLGSAVIQTQLAVLRIEQARDIVAGALRDELGDLSDLAARLVASDIELLQAYTRQLDRADQPEWKRTAQQVDDDIVDEALALMRTAVGNEDYNNAMSTAQTAYFHAKSAFEQWVMDWNYNPNPAADLLIQAEYGRGRDLLEEMAGEITAYLQLGQVPGAVFLGRLRDRMLLAATNLNVVAENGFDVQGALTDRQYLDALIDLRDAANFSGAAGNAGAWVRNYQWTMMQVVRFMTQASIEDAIYWQGNNRPAWPLYVTSRAYIEEGTTLLEERRVQGLIELYGQNDDTMCLLYAVYHCDFLTDEGANDADLPYPVEDIPDVCWDRMLQPAEWPGRSTARRPAACLWGDEAIEARAIE